MRLVPIQTTNLLALTSELFGKSKIITNDFHFIDKTRYPMYLYELNFFFSTLTRLIFY